jgi:hypothetical protein
MGEVVGFVHKQQPILSHVDFQNQYPHIFSSHLHKPNGKSNSSFNTEADNKLNYTDVSA